MSEVYLVTATPNLEQHMAYCARVSSPDNQNNIETAPKLLKYCMEHGHWSVFEMANIVIEINTTRDIARQILRHRSFSFQEFSQRYAQSNDFEFSEVRLQDYKNRQNSIETDDEYLDSFWEGVQGRLISDVKYLYNRALEHGIAKEVARKILPEGLTMSRMYVNGTVRSWLHYCDVRCGPETQKEHREVALKCRDVVQSLLPSLEIA